MNNLFDNNSIKNIFTTICFNNKIDRQKKRILFMAIFFPKSSKKIDSDFDRERFI